ncbi:aspartyl-phosphate phosphatase Spo0E family protein [Virgibacillus sp. MSP4-1]|uniref:aspartyl-phosphate phosphatase Spo0E family protein n=1 Tax=Virgibacillus sp. MSP4-1 TaxID=2700081 RepID=UPI00039A478A|nr:aspartyl-phosphate phosphatase Spo0E family protein [Virgibacillus sp. MSP4-1]
MVSTEDAVKLRKEIETVRFKMVEVATWYGFTSKESVEISQELDTLLNLYQAIEQTRT